MASAGLVELPDGSTFDTFEMAVTLLQLQIKADFDSVTQLAALLAEGVTFTHPSGQHSFAPSAPPARRWCWSSVVGRRRWPASFPTSAASTEPPVVYDVLTTAGCAILRLSSKS